jgi:REP element-mobilizing transposase RayT
VHRDPPGAFAVALHHQLTTQRRILESAARAGTTVAADDARLRELHALLRKAETCLDSGFGLCHMRDSRIAKVVADVINHFDGERYRLFAWCVMPNHVHAVFSPIGGHTLQQIVHSWKSFSATEANRLLGRTGRFWQREYFDHLIRREVAFARILRYVEENPRKAGLENWPWVKVAPKELLSQVLP